MAVPGSRSNYGAGPRRPSLVRTTGPSRKRPFRLPYSRYAGGGGATAKQEVLDLLQELPEDATLEDIQYHIYVKQKIAQGLADVRAGRVVSQEEVEKRFARWLEK